jgi:hypothetical protein
MTQERTSIVTACMNREENLLKVISSWLNSPADEIILVDWSCSTPLHKTLKSEGIDDDRIVIYRVEEEERWILTHAYNVGLKRASYSSILKLDNDHSITDDFFVKNSLSGLDTRLGSWRLARSEDQAYINGAFVIKTKALAAVGFFNEVITTYGWDDSYLHESLFAMGAKIGHLCPDSIRHIEQAEESRTKFQKINKEGLIALSVGVKATEFMNRRNMYLSALLPRQTQNTRQASYKLIDECNQRLHILKRESSPHLEIPESYVQQADRLAFRDFYCWKHGMLVENTCVSELEDEFIQSTTPINDSQDSENQVEHHSVRETNNQNSPNTFAFLYRKEEVHITCQTLPFMLSAYGHTDNTRKYQLVLDLNISQINTINNIMPNWCRDKVIAARPDNLDPDRVCIDASRLASCTLIGKLLLGSQDENRYFWASFNSLHQSHKRCLFDFIEGSGRPHQILADYYISSSPDSDLRRTITPEIYLRSLAAIYPSKNNESFSSFATKFKAKLTDGSDAASLLTADIIDDICKGTQGYTLTLVTSLYKGLKYVVDYAVNLRQMNLFERTQILISIVPSTEAELAYQYLCRFFKNDTNVEVSLLDYDPGLYECWNKGIRSARAKFVSNANADDRRGRYHTDYLVFISELYNLSAASSALLTDTKLTYTKYNQTQDVWYTGMGRSITKSDLFIENDGVIESQNLFHCMPIWRRDIHDDYGFFDEANFGTSCDWEFWLRCTSGGMRSRLVDLPLGFYLQDAQSHNRRSEDRKKGEQSIISRYISKNAIVGRLQ